MENSRKVKTTTSSTQSTDDRAHVAKAASDLMNESKKMANELYEEGLHRMNDARDNVMEYSDELLHKVKANPLTSVLVAGGVGFLLAILLKK